MIPPGEQQQPAPAIKPVRDKRAKAKLDPKVLAAARELRDRWLERINSGEFVPADSRYDVARIGQSDCDHSQAEAARALTGSQERARPMLLPAA